MISTPRRLEARGLTRVVGLLLAAFVGGAGCSRDPTPEVANKKAPTDRTDSRDTLSLEREWVRVTNVISTTIGFKRNSPPPWTNGNNLTVRFRKTPVPGQDEEWASWSVVNIHSENFAEITRRLKLDLIELRVWHLRKIPISIQPTGGVARNASQDDGYALVTDARIPRKWFLAHARGDRQVARELEAASPGSFRLTD